MTEKSSIIEKFFGNKTEEITAVAYLQSIEHNVNGVEEIGTSALLIVNNCIVGLFWHSHG